jgi:hypothetical protein
VAVALTALALEGKNGSTVTELFTDSEVLGDIDYPTGFGGMYWEDLDYFYIGLSHVGERADLSVDSSGALYFIVRGEDVGDPIDYTGLLRYDGTDFEHLTQAGWNASSSSGRIIVEVTVSPVTEGLLLADQPVIARVVEREVGVFVIEIVVMDASSLPVSETWLADIPTSSGMISMVIDADGAIYALCEGTLHKFTYGSGAYTGAELATGLGEGVVLGGDGALYSFPEGLNWGTIVPRFKTDILRVDPVTGATSVFADIELAGAHFRGWTSDSDGKIWIGLTHSNSDDYIIEVKQGKTIKSSTARTAVAEADKNTIRSLTGGPDGELVVLELAYGGTYVVSEVVPGEEGGGGGKPPKKPK